MLIVKILSYALTFYAGRLSYMFWRNKFLDDKKKELDIYYEGVSALLEETKRRDNEVRKKWQSMVADISRYEFKDREDNGVWTDTDQLYLNSWASAEKKEN